MEIITKRDLCEVLSRLYDTIESRKDELSIDDVLDIIENTHTILVEDMKRKEYHDPLAMIVVTDESVKSVITNDAEKYFDKGIDLFSHDIRMICSDAQDRIQVDILRKCGDVTTYLFKG